MVCVYTAEDQEFSNKPMLQKLTEASIRLLHKGIIPTQLTEQLQQLAAARKKTKREKFQKLEQDAPPEYKEVYVSDFLV